MTIVYIFLVAKLASWQCVYVYMCMDGWMDVLCVCVCALCVYIVCTKHFSLWITYQQHCSELCPTIQCSQLHFTNNMQKQCVYYCILLYMHDVFLLTQKQSSYLKRDTCGLKRTLDYAQAQPCRPFVFKKKHYPKNFTH